MHGPINIDSPNNTSKWQMGFNSAFKGLIFEVSTVVVFEIIVFWNFTSCHLVDEDFASPLYRRPL
jgi:hypothetical protein